MQREQPVASGADEVDQNLEMRYFSAESSWGIIDLRELWAHRDLIWILAGRDLRVRYRQTIVGVAWAIIQPLSLLVIFSLFFSLTGNQPKETNAPYGLIVLCGILPWSLFSESFTKASSSLLANQALLTKVHFPRAVLPISAILGSSVDFAIGLLLLVGSFAWFGEFPGWPLLFMPVFVVLAMLIALAFGFWLSALNVLYRDINYVIPFGLQIMFFVSPVIYETNAVVPEEWRTIYALNPIVGVLDGFRWSVVGQNPPDFLPMVLSMSMIVILLISGMVYFQRIERVLADRI